MSESDPPLYKPIPTRHFILGDSFETSPTDSPTNEYPNPITDNQTQSGGGTTPAELSKRSQSIKNLTTSALFGIYGPSAYDSTPGTPGATRRSSFTNLASNANELSGSDGSSLPSQRSRPLSNLTRHSKRRRNKDNPTILQQITRATLLFLSGASYGLIIARLHDQSRIAPVQVAVERNTPSYLVFWGISAVILGNLLPWADALWEDYVWESGGYSNGSGGKQGGEIGKGKKGDWEVTPVWNPAVRSIGAFVGIAYAIRKLPWQSTSQASLTLAFVNPVLWYLLDRTRTGFWLSAFVAIIGSVFLIGFNPDFVAIPTNDGLGILEKLRMGYLNGQDVSGESLQMQFIGATTWIASVLYVSSLCFGNIGRKLSGREAGVL